MRSNSACSTGTDFSPAGVSRTQEAEAYPTLRAQIRTAAGLTDRRARPQQEGVSNEDASCCRHSCDDDRSPRSGEGEAGAIGAPPARLSVVGATRLLPRLPSE